MIENIFTAIGSYDAEYILTKLNIPIFELADHELYELAFYDPINQYICIRENLGALLREYALAHELAHAIKHHMYSSPMFLSGFKDKLEYEANIFAFELMSKNHNITIKEMQKYIIELFPGLKV